MATMTRLFLAATAAIILVLFAMANTHVVTLSWLFGPPVQVRMISLLLIAFLAGAATVAVSGMRSGMRRRTGLKRGARSASLPDSLEELDLH
jgi:uncharacterized integral membrane protein